MTANPVSAADVRNSIRDALQSAKTYAYQHKDVYRRRLDHVLHQADDRIAQLEDQAAHASAAARKELEPQIRELRRLRDRAQTQVERVQRATPQAWDNLKTGVGSACKTSVAPFEQAGKHLR